MSIIAPSIDLKIEALYDCWAFLDLIGFQGGTDSFDSCHFDFMLCLQAYQLQQSGRLTGDLLKRWQRLSETESEYATDFRLLKFPRGHLKSTLVIGYVLWRTYRNPNITILQATNIRELSEAFIRELRSYYQDEYLQMAVWNSRPHITGNLIPILDKAAHRYEDNEAEDKKVIWSGKALQLVRDVKKKEPTILSTSVKSKVTGQHYNVVIMDDVVDFDNSNTPSKNTATKRWAADLTSVLTRIPDTQLCGTLPDDTDFYETLDGEYVVTGTNYNPEDYYVWIESNATDLNYSVFSRNIFTNGTDADDGYLWKKFTAKMEARLRKELEDSPGVFEAQYLNLVNNPALMILNTSDIQYAPERELLQMDEDDRFHVFTNPLTNESEIFTPIIAIDPAISLRARADYTAIVVGGKSITGRLIACEIIAGHLTPEFVYKSTIALITKWNIRTMYFEVSGFQSLYRKQLIEALAKEKVRCGVLDFVPPRHIIKEKRIELQLSDPFGAGQVIFSERIKDNKLVMNTFHFFGRGGKDDPPDAFAVVAEKAVQPGVSQKHKSPFEKQQVKTFNMHYGGIY